MIQGKLIVLIILVLFSLAIIPAYHGIKMVQAEAQRINLATNEVTK